MQRILIDGYNLLHADPGLHKRAGSDLERARGELIGRLAVYVAERSVRITVVFDGSGLMSDTEMPVPGRLQVVYSASGQTADEVIVEALRNSANAREYIVVTSDMADIGRSARGMGARVISSSSFLDRLGASGVEPESDAGGGEVGDDVDVDYWLERFSDRDREAE